MLKPPSSCAAASGARLRSVQLPRPTQSNRSQVVAPSRSFSFAFRGEPEHGGSDRLQSPSPPGEAARDGIRARIAALPGRIRRGAPLSPQDSAALQAVFQADDLAHVQDILVSAALAECSYKPVDHPIEEAVQLTREILADLVPPQLITLRSVQFCQPHVRHRYCLAESDEALYVGIMGTKMRRDLVTNANALQVRIWDDEGSAHQEVPAAHRGFLRRADAIPIEQLFTDACQRGKRLVICGHSLGGAVATLCTLRLLRQLPMRDDFPLRCVAFATPSIGNAALSALVAERRWDTYFSNFLLPEDVVVQLTSPSQYRAAGEWGPAGAGETRPDMRRLLNPTASMIATAATLTGLAAAAGVPATTAAAASAAAMAARARWNSSSNGSTSKLNGAAVGTEMDLEVARTATLANSSSGSSASQLLQAADDALLRARSLGNGTPSARGSLPSIHLAANSLAPRSGLLERWQHSCPGGSVSGSTDGDASSVSSSSSDDSTHAADRGVGSRGPFRFPWPKRYGRGGSARAHRAHGGMSVDSAGGDHTADAMPRTPNPNRSAHSSPHPAAKRWYRHRPRPGSLVVKPSMRVAASSSSSAAGGASPGTMLIDGRPATASTAAATPPAGSASLDQQPPAAWHWGPPDPMKAAAWAGARRAVRFASLPADAARGAAQIVSYPVRKAMSVARAYVPLSGSQMYVLPTRITANAQDLATSVAQTPAPGDQAAVGDGVLRDADITSSQDIDVSGETDSLDRQEVEELSADARRGDRDQRRSFFLMHRMASYRTRLRNVWQTAIGTERVAAWQAAASPASVVLTNTLGPRMTHLQAGGTLPAPSLPGPKSIALLFPKETAVAGRKRSGVSADEANVSKRWQVGNPLAWLGRRAAEARPAIVDVDITVLGHGLEHCSGVRITVNETGAACPLKIVRQPQAQFDPRVCSPPVASAEKLDRMLEVVPQFFARVQQAANAVLRNRAEAALLDSMTIRARIPAAVARSCSIVSSNPLLQLGADAPSGTGQLTIQLQSDFQTARLPLDLCATDAEAVMQRLLQQLQPSGEAR